MRLCMYQLGAAAKPGLCKDSHEVYDLSAAVEATGGDSAAAHASDVLEIVTNWDSWRTSVLAAMEAVDDGSGPDAVEGGVVTIPFPNPRRDAFAIGGNYRKHVEAASKTTGLALTKRKSPVFFMKPIGSFAGPADNIEFDPEITNSVDYEVELGVVLGRGGRDISREAAMEHVFGFMVVNDVSARDIMLRNKPQIDYFKGKGLDTFFPMGPGVTPREFVDDHRRLALSLRVNGELRQQSTANEMVRDIPEIIAELSAGLTLYPGDIIATGTPAGVAQEKENPEFLADGDVVESEVDSLGRLVNTVRARRRA